MSKLIGTKINGFIVEYVNNEVYWLKEIDNQLNHVTIDMKAKKVINARINSRNYHTERFLKKYNFLVELLDYTIKLYQPKEVVKPQKIFNHPMDIVKNIIETRGI